jgi:hypothetical protein
MANLLDTQDRPVSTSGGFSIPTKAPPIAPQTVVVPDNRDLESSRQPSAATDSSAGTLVIGREIILSGEVTSCTRLRSLRQQSSAGLYRSMWAWLC